MIKEELHIHNLTSIVSPKILLVDDNESINFFNKIIIKKFNDQSTIVTCKNGFEAIKEIEQLFKQKLSFDIIFLDINMPVMDGWEFLDELKKNDLRITNTKIIFTIGRKLNNEDKDRINAYNLNYSFSKKMISKEYLSEITLPVTNC